MQPGYQPCSSSFSFSSSSTSYCCCRCFCSFPPPLLLLLPNKAPSQPLPLPSLLPPSRPPSSLLEEIRALEAALDGPSLTTTKKMLFKKSISRGRGWKREVESKLGCIFAPSFPHLPGAGPGVLVWGRKRCVTGAGTIYIYCMCVCIYIYIL